MTAVRTAAATPRLAPVGTAVAAAGCALLMARPLLYRHHIDPVPVLIALFPALGLVGAFWPITAVKTERAPALPVLLIGLVAFAASRSIGGGHPLLAASGGAIALNTVAAV